MKIFISSDHQYPASIGGLGGPRVHDCLVKGLIELGHEVFYRVEGIQQKPDFPIRFVDRPIDGMDIWHYNNFPLEEPEPPAVNGIPWVKTFHAPHGVKNNIPAQIPENWIFVSPFHASSFGKTRHVKNAIDPSEFQYSENKEDFFLFLFTGGKTGGKRAKNKGIDIVFELVKRLDIHVKVAGLIRDKAEEAAFAELCKGKKVEYVGEIFGTRKAEMFASAKALLFPTQFPEPFGLVMAEALVSGTPVIASDKGACPDLISENYGFVCSTIDDYIKAVQEVSKIDPKACRDKAFRDFHYLRMAEDYVKEYQIEIAKNN